MEKEAEIARLRKIAFVSDLQVPFFNEASVKSVGRFLAKWRPHRTICIGDEIDLPQLGGFNAGTIDEMVGNINDDRKQTQLMAPAQPNTGEQIGRGALQ